MTTPKSVYLFLCPGMADWEPAYAISLLSDQYTDIPKNNSYPVRTFGVTQEPVRSVGGLTLVPDFSVDERELLLSSICGTCYDKMFKD